MTNVVVLVAGGWGDDGWGVTAYGQDNVPELPAALTTSVGSVTISEGSGVAVNVTGVSATSAVGDVTLATDQNVSPTGVSATGGVGSITATGVSRVEVTGVAATGEVNSLRFDALVTFAGWGRGAWGEGAWSQNVTINAAVGGVGSVEVISNVDVDVVGLEATSAVGAVTVVEGSGIVVNLTGLSATGSVGDVAVIGDSSVTVSGVAATGSVGEVTQRTTQVIPAFAPAPAQGVVGSGTQVIGDATVYVTGVEASASVKGVLVWGEIIPSAGTIWTEIAA